MEKFCLKWNDFQDTITSSYKSLRESSDFSDVTLICEDNNQVEAHKIILSACSPFFMNVLQNNKHSHPIIYMRGLNKTNLMALLDFMYNGEANILQVDLGKFLELAVELQLKGLAGHTEEETCEGFSNTNMYENVKCKTKSPPKMPIKEEYQEILCNEIGTISDINTTRVEVDHLDDLDEQINNMMHKGDGSSVWTCSVCGKNSIKKSNMRQHIGGKHIMGAAYPCDQCGQVSRFTKFLS